MPSLASIVRQRLRSSHTATAATMAVAERVGRIAALVNRATGGAVARGIGLSSGDGYWGANTSKRNTHWYASNTDANAPVRASLPFLRDRTSQQQRDNWLVRRAINERATYLWGTGVKIRPKHDRSQLNELAEVLWNAWCENALSINDHTTFAAVGELARRAVDERGECLVRYRPRRAADGLAVPFQVELIEADQLPLDKNEAVTDDTGDIVGRIQDGIESDSIGRIVAYHILREHPGSADYFAAAGAASATVRVPASQVLHLKDPGRIAMRRGVPITHAVLQDLKQIADYDDSYQVAKAISASIALVVLGGDPIIRKDGGSNRGIITPESQAAQTTDQWGLPVETIEPGLIINAPNGEDVKTITPTQSPDFAEFKVQKHHEFAAGVDVPYAFLTGDMRNSNYSSNMLGVNDFSAGVEMRQKNTIVPQFVKGVWRWFCQTAYIAGLLPTSDIPIQITPVRVRLAGSERMKTTQADIAAVANGLKSPLDVIIENGGDPKEVAAGFAEYLKLLDEAGMKVTWNVTSDSSDKDSEEDDHA